jgi:hypothetical protein
LNSSRYSNLKSFPKMIPNVNSRPMYLISAILRMQREAPFQSYSPRQRRNMTDHARRRETWLLHFFKTTYLEKWGLKRQELGLYHGCVYLTSVLLDMPHHQA